MDSKTNYKNMLLVLLLVVAGLAGAIAPQTAAAKDYGIHIGGKMITSDNYTDISASGGFKAVQSGTVTYDPASYTLTLNNATIEANDLGIYIKGKMPQEFRIILVGNNTIISRRHSIETSDKAFGLGISGGGTLTLTPKTSDRAIFINTADLRIMDCTINAKGPIYVKNGDLTINKATVKMDLSYGSSAFIVSGPIKLEGCWIASPSGADIGKFKGNTTVMLDGKPCEQVTILPGGGAKPQFTLNPKELKLGAYAIDYKYVTLSCNVPYLITDIKTPFWIEIGGYEGRFKYMTSRTLRFLYQINSGNEREGVITIITTDGPNSFKHEVKVTQEGGADPKSFITLAPEELKVNANGGEYEVELFTHSKHEDFDVNNVTGPSWMKTFSGAKAQVGDYKYTFKFNSNTGSERTGEIVFKIGPSELKLKVTQAGGAKPEPKPEAELTLDPKELKVEAEGGEHKVTLSSTLIIEKMDFEEPDWIRCRYSPEGHTSKAVYLTIKSNTGPERSGEITFKTNAGDVTLKVTQAAGSTKPEPEKAVFTLDPKELKVEADGGKKEVKLSSNQPYHITGVDKPDWLLVGGTNPGLEAIQKITMFIQPNTGAERKADVVFKTDKGDVTLKVTQAAGSTKPEKAVFTLEPKELKVETDGGKKEVTISCNKAFNIEGWHLPSWLNASTHSKKAETVHKITIQIKPNTGAERMGDVVFDISTDQSQEAVKLKVTQAGKKEKPEPKPTLELSTESLTFPAEGGKQTVNVTANGDWYAGLAEGVYAAWVKITPDMAAGTLTVEVGPYKGTKKRAARVAFSSEKKGKDGQPIERSLFVRQEAAKTVEPPVAATGISLNPAAMTMGSGGGTVGFNVYAGKGWTISGSPEWMHPDATRGSGTRLVIVRFDRNESGAERTGKLTVKSDDGKAERTFTLTQRAGQRKPTPSPGSTPSEEYDYDLALNPEEITVGPSEGAGSSISVVTGRLWAGSTTEDWIRLESAVGRGNGTFTFTVAPNPSKEMRHGTITVRTQQGMDELKVAIHQQGNDGSVVPPAEVKVSNVTLDPATLTVNGDLSTALISAIVSPDNARNKGLLWMSSNASVATVKVFTPKQSAALPQLRFAPDADDYALVTIVGKGKAVITAASDGSGIVARCEVNVLSTVANTVPYAPQAKVYTVGPTLYLSLPTPETVQVYTLAGTLYRTWQAPAGDTSVTLPAGTYIIKVGQLTEKVHVPR